MANGEISPAQNTARSHMTVPQAVIGVMIAALLSVLTAGFWKLWEVDATQDAVLARLIAIDSKFVDRKADVNDLHVEIAALTRLIDLKSADRYTGKNAADMQEKSEIEHTYMWSAINELQNRVTNLHDYLFKP